MGFEKGCKVVVEQVDDQNWEVREPFKYLGDRDVFEVKEGQDTDFASTPKTLTWFLPRYGRYTKAAILHDYLWRKRAGRDVDFIDADALFRRAMRELEVPFLRRWIMWAAVRWGALVKQGGRKGWLREAWRVLLFTIVAAPVVVPPVIVISLSLLLFALMELIVWVPVRIVEAVQRTRGAEAKPSHLPKFEPKL